MNSIRNVVFDLGGVLLDWNPGKILAACYEDESSRAEVGAALFRHADWTAFNRGDISETELLERVQARTGRCAAELNRVRDAVLDSLVEKPETVAVLQELHSFGIPLYCLSDMPVSVYRHVRERATFWGAFRGIVISGEVGVMKPSREVFACLLGRYGLRAAETAFIDDHPPNIAGAMAVGIDGILFRDAEQCRSEMAERLGISGR